MQGDGGQRTVCEQTYDSEHDAREHKAREKHV
jgi:hypothetical protein